MQANRRFVVAMVAAAVLLGCTAVLGIVIGSTSVGIDDVLALAFGADADQTAANVIWNIRLPRVLAALLAGAALAQAGALIHAYVGASGFLIGGLSGVKLDELIVPSCAICAVLVLGLLQGTQLNLLSLGEHQAHSLGLNVRCTRLVALVSAAALAGCAVSFAGLIGFVGLIVPHAVRTLVGHDNRRVLAMAPLLGGLLVCLCDLLARTMFSPYEIPVGIVLSLLGGPFFVYLILRRGKGGLNG